MKSFTISAKMNHILAIILFKMYEESEFSRE
jgi:hypothetical protein